MKGLSVERLNGESSGMKGREKGNRRRAIAEKKGGRRRIEPNREMNPKEERKLKMRKVDSEVYTVRRDLINPSNLIREDGFCSCRKRLRTVYYTLRFYITGLHNFRVFDFQTFVTSNCLLLILLIIHQV